MNTATGIAVIVSAAVVFLGASTRWVSRIITAVGKVIQEIQNNTKAVKDLNGVVENNNNTIHEKLADHEVRIVKLEGK